MSPCVLTVLPQGGKVPCSISDSEKGMPCEVVSPQALEVGKQRLDESPGW